MTNQSTAGTGRASAGSTLSGLDELMLAFERRHPVAGRAKDAAIRATFDMSPSAYHVRLSYLIDAPEAMAYAPLLVQRLHRRELAHHQWHTAPGQGQLWAGDVGQPGIGAEPGAGAA